MAARIRFHINGHPYRAMLKDISWEYDCPYRVSLSKGITMFDRVVWWHTISDYACASANRITLHLGNMIERELDSNDDTEERLEEAMKQITDKYDEVER